MNFDEHLQKGITHTNIEHIERITGSNAQLAYKEALAPVVTDAQLLDVLCTEHNIQKFKQRFETQLHINEGGKRLAELTVVGKTLLEASNDMRALIDQVGEIDKNYPKPLQEFLHERGITLKKINATGNVLRIDATLIFRKAT